MVSIITETTIFFYVYSYREGLVLKVERVSCISCFSGNDSAGPSKTRKDLGRLKAQPTIER